MTLRVFISYRHTDGRHVAGRLRDRLAASFGEENVFFDVESIAFGLDFRTVISERLQTVDVVVALIGPHFAPERLAQPNDVVRLELSEAFRLDKLVVPVLVGDAPVPSPDELPAELEQLAYLRAAPLRDDPDFRTDVARLVDSLTATIAQRRATPPPTAEPAAEPEPAPAPEPGPEPAPRPAVDPIGMAAPVTLRVGEARRLERHHTKQVRDLAFSPDGTRLLSGGDSHTAELWDPGTGKLVSVLRGHTNWVTAVAFSPDGRSIATASYDRSAILWDAATGQHQATLGQEGTPERHTSQLSGVSFTADGDTVVTAAADGLLKTWHRATGEPRLTVAAHTQATTAVACSPTEPLIATGGGGPDPTVRLWSPLTGAQVAVLSGHGSYVAALAFSPDGRLLVSSSGDDTVRVWQVADHRPLRTFDCPVKGNKAVAFSPDGRLVAGGADKSIRVWDWTVGSLVATLRDHGNRVWAVTFSPDGRLLASAGGGELFRGDNLIRLWPLGP